MEDPAMSERELTTLLSLMNQRQACLSSACKEIAEDHQAALPSDLARSAALDSAARMSVSVLSS